MQKKWEKILPGALGFGLYFAFGAAAGVQLGRTMARYDGVMPFGLCLALGLVLLVAALFLQIILHEAGHLVCGLLTGYRFCSFRIGSLMLYRAASGLRFGRYSLPGTGGQCLLAPPASPENMPVALYNLGGCLMNALTAALFTGVAACCPAGTWGACFLWSLVLSGALFALLNGIPISNALISNDGSNALTFRRDPAARRALWLQLSVHAEITAGRRLRELPEEWFALPESFAAAGPIACSNGYLALCRALDIGDDAAAVAAGKRLLEEAGALPGIHRLLVQQELLFLRLVGVEAAQDTPARPDAALERFWKQAGKLLSTQRMRYAVALLLDGDPAAAGRAERSFGRLAAAYPYPGEAAGEREQLARVRRAAGVTAEGGTENA